MSDAGLSRLVCIFERYGGSRRVPREAEAQQLFFKRQYESLKCVYPYHVVLGSFYFDVVKAEARAALYAEEEETAAREGRALDYGNCDVMGLLHDQTVEWLADNTDGLICYTSAGQWYFTRKRDAALFKLFFAG